MVKANKEQHESEFGELYEKLRNDPEAFLKESKRLKYASDVLFSTYLLSLKDGAGGLTYETPVLKRFLSNLIVPHFF